jgi:hypothetical protein
MEKAPNAKPYFIHPPGSPVKELSLQVPLTELPQREALYFYSLLHPSLKVSGK